MTIVGCEIAAAFLQDSTLPYCNNIAYPVHGLSPRHGAAAAKQFLVSSVARLCDLSNCQLLVSFYYQHLSNQAVSVAGEDVVSSLQSSDICEFLQLVFVFVTNSHKLFLNQIIPVY